MSVPQPSFPTLALPPQPLPSDSLPVGLLLPRLASPASTPLNEAVSTPAVTALSDKDFDDAGHRWYKDVITLSTQTGKFMKSLGGTMLIEEKEMPGKDIELGTIEAEEMRVRSLKDTSAALQKVVSSEEGRSWIEHVQREYALDGNTNKPMGFVTAVREVKNACYKHAGVVKAGNGMWEVVREIQAEESQGKGKRRDSGLDVNTGCKWDAIDVEVRRVEIKDGKVVMSEVLEEDEVKTLL